jgi:hypothetical protein
VTYRLRHSTARSDNVLYPNLSIDISVPSSVLDSHRNLKILNASRHHVNAQAEVSYGFRTVTHQPLNFSLSQQATIVELPDKVLLDIFHYFLDGSPRHWPTLVHICRKWRRIVFASQHALHLRLLCTHGTPVQKTLDCWPASLPIVVEYGGSPGLDAPAPEDEHNTIAALEQSNRVRSISLTVTSSLRERLFAISGSFSELEDLVLLSRESEQLILPYFFGGAHIFVVSTQLGSPLSHSFGSLIFPTTL